MPYEGEERARIIEMFMQCRQGDLSKECIEALSQDATIWAEYNNKLAEKEHDPAEPRGRRRLHTSGNFLHSKGGMGLGEESEDEEQKGHGKQGKDYEVGELQVLVDTLRSNVKFVEAAVLRQDDALGNGIVVARTTKLNGAEYFKEALSLLGHIEKLPWCNDITLIYTSGGKVIFLVKQFNKVKPVLDKIKALINEKAMNKITAFSCGPPARSLKDNATLAAKQALNDMLGKDVVKNTLTFQFPRLPRAPGWCCKHGNVVILSGEDVEHDMVTIIAVKSTIKINGNALNTEELKTRIEHIIAERITRFTPEAIFRRELVERGHSS
eukprot:TRINITY_DN75412_c0_g1_i1.p1 TRINITY_DN75412_c0_g1~~TRINITY_DN75412_c0_g1_i1.p1  ORF type:complete len:325 (-),score=42.97 TRINITY_DN75412_c0_g1_i1:16-990(-)